MHQAHVNESRRSNVVAVFAGVFAMLLLADASAASGRVDQQVRAALQLDQNPERGAKLYAEQCARCHLNTRGIAENLTGFFTGRIDGYTLLDLSLIYDVNDQLNVAATLKNATDERYIASLRQGIYVGPERGIDVALRYRF